MKIAYRIVTPILAVGAIVMGIFLDMFNFVIGSGNDRINNLLNAITSITDKLNTNYGFSVFEILGMLKNQTKSDDGSTFTEIIKPIMPRMVAFLVIMFIIVGILIALAVCSAAIADKKKRNLVVYSLVGAGFVFMFVNIIVSNSAFDHITAGDIDITELVKLFSDSTFATIATLILSVKVARLSAGFYAMFGIFILVVIWTIIANFVIQSPIVPAKKTYKRKKPSKFGKKSEAKTESKSESKSELKEKLPTAIEE